MLLHSGSTGEAARAASAESVQATGAEIVSAPAEVTETGAAAAIVPTAPASTTHSLLGRLLRTNSGGITSKGSGNQQPVCLICLENLGPDDFEVSCAATSRKAAPGDSHVA